MHFNTIILFKAGNNETYTGNPIALNNNKHQNIIQTVCEFWNNFKFYIFWGNYSGAVKFRNVLHFIANVTKNANYELYFFH